MYMLTNIQMLSHSLIHVNMFKIYSNILTSLSHIDIHTLIFAYSHIYTLKKYVHTLMYLHWHDHTFQSVTHMNMLTDLFQNIDTLVILRCSH